MEESQDVKACTFDTPAPELYKTALKTNPVYGLRTIAVLSTAAATVCRRRMHIFCAIELPCSVTP